ncbi:phospho-sugar mutase [Clostridium baratii]|uniref:phosphoglucomutase (alpha-D-glucose-1,6-bisphosphate-dependent) n=1 Tax=Clostridium baratii TaxID=1561 RepID=A0A174SRZ5_9CLOT|nr:phospho-sugar mutase [Clostridium baratii]CUP97329.1 phosphoglucomutase/phosphomannomutase alpha/beta/alpha domain I [Clostridium baratii]
MNYKDKYNNWLENDLFDESIKKELREIKEEKEIEDRFYKDLEFGTGGLRGIIGAGSNRLNIYTVGKATEGLARYLKDKYKEYISVSIAYDSRNMSPEFAETAALILVANGIKANLFESLRPTPELSFTVRELKSKAGIVLTASHNPKEYNGYKVYGEDGCQITDEAAKAIITEINNIDYKDIKKISKEEALENGLLNIIGEEVDKKFIDTLKGHTIRKDLVKENAKNLKIIYTPIHGTGLMPVTRILRELGYENLHVVKEQEKPDGNFPTASYPNPEDPKVFKIALDMAKELNPDIIFGTDPDADRIGAVVKDSEGEYQILTGNQMGVLLTHYILDSYKELNNLPDNGAVIKTIVTTEMVRNICKDYNVKLFDVLTGFKYIGEMMTDFENTNSNKFLFGFEESYGCLFGDHARDRDAVIAAQMIAEMTLYYKNKGLSLYEGFINLCEKYGYYKENLISIELKGKEGQEKIKACLDNLRKNPIKDIKRVKVKTFFDYKESIEKDLESGEIKEVKLPKSNVLKYVLEDGSWFVVRPSGTEPKMKVYLAVVGEDLEDSNKKIKEFEKNIMKNIVL